MKSATPPPPPPPPPPPRPPPPPPPPAPAEWGGVHTMKIFSNLTHFKPMFHFYISWKHQKTSGFLVFPGRIEVEHWLKMGFKYLQYISLILIPQYNKTKTQTSSLQPYLIFTILNVKKRTANTTYYNILTFKLRFKKNKQYSSKKKSAKLRSIKPKKHLCIAKFCKISLHFLAI